MQIFSKHNKNLMDFVKLFSRDYEKVIVELGMGDGMLIESLARNDQSSLYVGIELNNGECKYARSKIVLNNVIVINGSFEEIIPAIPNTSIDGFIDILPDPAYIDKSTQHRWLPLYNLAYTKLKKKGTFQLITEITNELFEPVDDNEYAKWAEWLKTIFSSIGFSITNDYEGTPANYISRCLHQFRNDPKRIRMITLEMIK